MATESSPKPIYHSPNGLGCNHSRRNSSRRSFTSTALPSLPKESPRPLCPRDGDSYSYKPRHLPAWYVSQDLWERLPGHIQSPLTALQHAGAAVLTGYERLEKHSEDRDNDHAKAIDDEMDVQLEESILLLPTLDTRFPPKLRTESTTSSALTESTIWSPVFSSQSSGSASPDLSASQTTSPISPICLTPADAEPPANRPCDRLLSKERSFCTPLEPHNAYYATELSQLRTESIPRLRHAARKVETEWYDCKRQGAIPAHDIAAFEQWWAEKKSIIVNLNEKCKQLSVAFGMGPAGMGWTAP